jgi:hypothetical protein
MLDKGLLAAQLLLEYEKMPLACWSYYIRSQGSDLAVVVEDASGQELFQVPTSSLKVARRFLNSVRKAALGASDKYHWVWYLSDSES